jgi:hypothetical protein
MTPLDISRCLAAHQLWRDCYEAEKRSLFVVLAFLLTLSLSACGGSDSQTESAGGEAVAQTTQESKSGWFSSSKSSELSFKDAVKNYKIWFSGVKAIEKDKSPATAIVFGDNEIIRYKIDSTWGLTFGEITNMSDDEIISLLETNRTDENSTVFDQYDIVIKTDSTGNETICEYIELHVADTPEDSNRYRYPDNNKDNCFISSQQIYNSYFCGYFRTMSGMYSDGTAYFVTKCDKDTTFVYDQPGTPDVKEN